MNNSDRNELAKHRCLVVNLFGEPCAGKSTGAAYVFSRLKMLGYKAELVTEFAKDLVWEQSAVLATKDIQPYVFGQQYYRQLRCVNDVDVLITDSPLPLSIIYNDSTFLKDEFNQTVMSCFDSFNNVSFFVCRKNDWDGCGRMHTMNESEELQHRIVLLLNNYQIPFQYVDGNQSGYDKIVQSIVTKMEVEKNNDRN